MRRCGYRTAFLACLLLMTPITARAEIVGHVISYQAKAEETVFDIARHFDIGVEALAAANFEIDFSKPLQGIDFIIPAAHVVPVVRPDEIVINLAERRLYYLSREGKLMTFPIAIGKAGWETQLGKTKIVKKRKNPIWIPPESLRIENPDLPAFIPPGPENPLGEYALNLGWEGFVIHGTNAPKSIGRRASHGCIRLYPEDIAKLFSLVEVGTRVGVIDIPYKMSWVSDQLYLEVAPSLFSVEWGKEKPPVFISDIYAAIRRAGGPTARIDWRLVDAALARHDGIPTIIGKK
jgi:L,D-transpeptidase ErfK/SrfK